MDVLERIKQSKSYNAIAIICVLFTFCTIIRAVLIYFNRVPGYYVEWHRTDSIMPVINLFPGQKIRFDMGFYESSPNILSAKWEIIKGTDHFGIDETKPTFVLPPAKGGTYLLRVTATTIDGKVKRGEGTLNIVQDEPVPVKLAAPTQVKITSQDANPVLLKEIQSKGVEVYSGNGQWAKVENVSSTANGVSFALPSNENVSLYGSGNQVLFRVKNATNKLNDYGAAVLQRNNTANDKEKKISY